MKKNLSEESPGTLSFKHVSSVLGKEAMSQDGLYYLTITEAAGFIREKKLSPKGRAIAKNVTKKEEYHGKRMD